MENNVFEELYKGFAKVDITKNKITNMYSHRNSENGNFYIDGNNLYPSINILDEDNKEYYEQFFDFNIEELSKASKEDIEITPAKISGKTIEKGSIKVKIKEEVIEETPVEGMGEVPKVEANEELEKLRKEALDTLERLEKKTPEFETEVKERIEFFYKRQDQESLKTEIANLNNYIEFDKTAAKRIEEYKNKDTEKKADEVDEKLEETRKRCLDILNSMEDFPEKQETIDKIMNTTDINFIEEEIKRFQIIVKGENKLKELREEIPIETNTKDNIIVEEVADSTKEEKKVETKVETVEVKNDISFDYYGKTEIENIQKELMNNITDLKYSFIEQKKKTEQKKQKLEEIFNPMPPLDPKRAETNKKVEEERYRLNRINNLLNSDNFKALLEIENTINSITIEHNKETKKYHVTSKVNPYELAQRTAGILNAISSEVNSKDLGNKVFVNNITNKIQQINNNMKALYSKFGYTEIYFDIKTKYDKINYLNNQIKHWKDLEKIHGKSYEREINEALYEIEVIKNTIKSLIDNLPEEEKAKLTNIEEIRNIIEEIDNVNKEPEIKDTPEETENNSEDSEAEKEYNDREELINIIKGIVGTISLEEPEEITNKKLDEIEKYLVKLNKLDQLEFEEKYKNATTDEEKQQLINERENQIESYRGLFKHENKEIENLLGARFNPLIDKFKNEIVKDKDKTDDIPDDTPEIPEDEPEQEKDIPKKGKLKVIAKKALKWMKEHKLATVAIGLALTTALLFAIPTTHMMINSALWNVGAKLGWSAGTLGKLHSINLGLSKAVAGGAYAFEGMSGAYTLGGAVGAQALYGAGAANLVGAIAGLTGLGAIGTFGATIVNKIKNWKKKKNKEKETPIEEPKKENEEIIDIVDNKAKEKELDLEKEKSTNNVEEKTAEKSTPLTKEQIAEMIKAEVEKAVAAKNQEIANLTAENAALREEIEKLKAQGLQPEEIEEENVMKK